MTNNILRIDASASSDTSVTRKLTDAIIARLGTAQITVRDLAAQPLPQIDTEWVTARALPQDQRSQGQADHLALSDKLIAEIEAADTLVIGVPIYNFTIPAALKAWVDQIARVGVTFHYTDKGPQGLIKGKRAILAVASGGVPVGSGMDFATGYMKTVLGFLGITDVSIIAAERVAADAEASLANANKQIAALAA